MAINKNHEFEELNGVKCGIVEKNVTPDRFTFLKSLLEHNGYTVIAVPGPTAETYTVGVTDYTFNPINALFGRSLKTPNGHVVTLAYWQQKETVSQDEIPYYER